MIDLKHEAENFIPMELTPEEIADGGDINWAYKLYNKSLEYIEKGFVDMARQNLKKALGLNPDLYPARMLLGVCLFENGDRVGAMRMFNAIKNMKYKRLALAYYDYLSEEAERPPEESGKVLILSKLYKESLGETDTAETAEPEKSSASSSKEEKKDDDIPIDDDGKIVIPKFMEDRQRERQQQVIIQSHTNDGVVEEIVKQKREAAQESARKAGETKAPFSYNSVYSKKVFGEEYDEADFGKTQETEKPRSKKDSFVISVASILILIYLVIVSVFLIQNMTETRRLKNEYADLQKQYEEAIVTPSPRPHLPPSPSPLPTEEPEGEGETDNNTENENTD